MIKQRKKHDRLHSEESKKQIERNYLLYMRIMRVDKCYHAFLLKSSVMSLLVKHNMKTLGQINSEWVFHSPVFEYVSLSLSKNVDKWAESHCFRTQAEEVKLRWSECFQGQQKNTQRIFEVKGDEAAKSPKT